MEIDLPYWWNYRKWYRAGDEMEPISDNPQPDTGRKPISSVGIGMIGCQIV